MKIEEKLAKRDAIVSTQQIVSMDKYNVLGHETIDMSADQDWGLDILKGSTDILVIYLKK